jgi:hypothetical protein
MAKHKTVTHVPPAASSPRLFPQLMTAIGELIAVAVLLLGVVTLSSWVVAGYDVYARMARPDRPRSSPSGWEVCRLDRHFGEMCAPADRPPPARRHYARDVY